MKSIFLKFAISCCIALAAVRYVGIPYLDYQRVISEADDDPADPVMIHWQPAEEPNVTAADIAGREYAGSWNIHYVKARSATIRFGANGTVYKSLTRSYSTIEGKALYHIEDGKLIYSEPEGDNIAWLFPQQGEPIRAVFDGQNAIKLYTLFGDRVLREAK